MASFKTAKSVAISAFVILIVILLGWAIFLYLAYAYDFWPFDTYTTPGLPAPFFYPLGGATGVTFLNAEQVDSRNTAIYASMTPWSGTTATSG